MKKADQFGKPISPGSFASNSKGKSIEIEGIEYREVPPNKYACLECGTQINKVLANAHSFKHMRQRIAANTSKEVFGNLQTEVFVARKKAAPPAPPKEPISTRRPWKTQVTSNIKVLPQKRPPNVLVQLREWRHTEQTLHRLARHFHKAFSAALLVGFRSLRSAT